MPSRVFRDLFSIGLSAKILKAVLLFSTTVLITTYSPYFNLVESLTVITVPYVR